MVKKLEVIAAEKVHCKKFKEDAIVKVKNDGSTDVVCASYRVSSATGRYVCFNEPENECPYKNL